MKKTILKISILLMSVNMFSQMSFNIPLNTVHYKNKDYYKSNQGGSYGLLASYSHKKYVFGLGLIENSFGRVSKIAVLGMNFNKFGANVGFVVGVADNYPKEIKPFYKISVNKENINRVDVELTTKPVGLTILPLAIAFIKIPVYKNMGVQINISPLYVNSGIYINLK